MTTLVNSHSTVSDDKMTSLRRNLYTVEFNGTEDDMVSDDLPSVDSEPEDQESESDDEGDTTAVPCTVSVHTLTVFLPVFYKRHLLTH